jgi:dTDP-4-dehydrorhamnose reductase
MPKLLLTGVSGFLGWHISQAAQLSAQSAWEIFGTYHQNPVAIPGVSAIAVDLTHSDTIAELFDQIQPDAVIHTAALSQPNACQQDPDRSYAINVLASTILAEQCAQAKIPYLFTSSEQVFAGTHPPYRETDLINPINLYGEHKALAEVQIHDRYPGAIVCRMPLMYGAAPTANSFIQPFIQQLRQGQALSVFSDEIRMPASGDDAAQGLLMLLDRQLQGQALPKTLHLNGPESLSRYAMAQMLAEILEIPHAVISPCYQADVPMAAPRPQNLTMDNTIAQRLGYRPRKFRDEIQRLRLSL